MKSWVSDRRLAAGIFALVLVGLCSTAFANVGRTAGTFAVSPAGAATYNVPIWAPRGPNGLEPQLALVYNSQQASGYLGVGWSLSGISSITRCNLTVAQDGTAAPVALSASDGLCLDGQRLRLTGGTYGTAGSTYQTEIANFEQVTAYESAGTGPAYFIVQAPNGTQYEYGNAGGSQVLAYNTSTALAWYLDKVTDTAGNTMTFSYSSAGLGSVVPTTISWTPSSYGATTYNYTMQFAYGTNSTTSSYYGYVGGTEVTNTALLQSITVNYEGTTVKKYALTYQSSASTGAEELTQLEECADAAQSNCLAPTTFGYQAPPVGTTSTAITATSGPAGAAVWNYDFNGDGQKDLAYCSANPQPQVFVAFASSSGGYDAPLNTGVSCAVAPVLYGDFLGNGQDGILARNGSTWYYYQWNGSSFAGQSTGLAYDNSAVQYVAADVDGDGRPDLVEMTEPGSPITITISVRLNMSSASTVSFSPTNAVWYATTVPANTVAVYAELQSGSDGQSAILQSGNVKRFDFNGDGRDDLAFEHQTMWCVTFRGVCTDHYTDSSDELISTGSSFTDTQIASQSTMTAPIVAFLNFNSDKCTDYLIQSTIYISGCDGTTPATVTVPSSSVVGVMDWNADGRGDILVNNGGTIGVYESTGTNLGNLISTSIPYSSQSQYFGFDQAGDQLDALGVWEMGASPSTIVYYSHNGTGVPADLITSITDGYGNFAKPTYVSLPQAPTSIYTRGSSSAPSCSPGPNDCYENYNGSMYVVSQVTYSDPSNQPNGTYTSAYAYSDATMSIDGRGFAGFQSQQVTDSRNKVAVNQTFAVAFPFIFMPGTRTVTNLTTGNTVSTTVDSVTYTELSSTTDEEVWFPYISSSTEKDYEVGGADSGNWITTKSANYSYDNYGNIKVASQTITDKDSGSPYAGDSWTKTITNTPDVDTSTWCLRLSSEVQTSYTALDGSPAVTRTQDFTSPDTTHCRYTEIKTEPNSNYEVTEDIGYDDSGNVNSDAITGSNMATRYTSADWGPTGQFPMTVFGPNGAVTTFNYDFSYGLVSSEIDPNSTPSDQIVTSWQYDGFGRAIQETRPDHTYTTWAYNLNTGGPLARLIVAEQPHDTAGNVITTTQYFYDMLDRPLYRIDTLLDGTSVWGVDHNYDWLGRIVINCAPHAVNSASPGCTTYNYDLLDRVTQAQRPINQSDGTLQTTKYGYAGRTTTITDPNAHTRTLIQDVNGWLRQTEDDLGYNVILGYDAAGNKTSVTDSLGNPLWTGTYAYGIAPFLVGEKDLDRGTWGYTVDALGERTAWTDPKGKQFYATYDALSRPVTRTEPDLFTQWTWGSSTASHNIGKLASVCSGTGSTCSSSYYSENESYDNLGRLSQRSLVIPPIGTYTYTWQYNATTGLLDSLTYPMSTSGQALELKYAYQSGILQSITDILDSPNVTIWQASAENPAEQITQETLGNGLVTSRAYDGVTHWLSSVESGPGGGASIQNQSFLYDEVGNVSQRQDNNLGLSENFYYDGDNRLSYSTLNGTQNLSLNYNGMGNITSRSDVAGGATWTYDSIHVHEVTQAGSTAYVYAYDANGNITSRQGSSISWSSYNYPTTINDAATGESVSLLYGPDRRAYFEQTQSSSGTETNYHVGGLLDIVTAGGVTDYRHYIYAGTEPVAMISRKSNGVNTPYYLLSDHQGSIAAITNSAGAVVVGESFTAYGSRRNPSTWSGAPSSADLNTIAGITRQGYTFQDALGQMGLNDMVGRVQDAITGRFLSADPTIPDPTDPQSYNRYSYTRNNPLTYTDPSGFEDDSECAELCPDGGAATPASPPPMVPWPGPRICIGCDDPPATGDISGLLSELTGAGPYQGGALGSHIGGGKNSTSSSVPSKPQQQTTLQKFKNWLCNAGNSLVGNAEKLGSTGLTLEVSGAVTFGLGVVGQPEVNPAADVAVGAGAAVALTGAAAGTLASIMQVGGGIAQMIGSNDSSVGANNALGGSASLAAGAGTGWVTGGSNALTQAIVGATSDTAVSMMPGMSSGQAQCGN